MFLFLFLLIHLKAGTVHSGNSSVIGQSNVPVATTDPAQNIKFSIKDFFSKCDQIRMKLRIRKSAFFVHCTELPVNSLWNYLCISYVWNSSMELQNHFAKSNIL